MLRNWTVLLSAAFLLLSTTVIAQTHVGVSAGYGLHDMRSLRPLAGAQEFSAAHYELFAEHQLTSALIVGGGVRYAQSGNGVKSFFTDEMGLPTQHYSASTYAYTYLSAPIKVAYGRLGHDGNARTAFISLGLRPSLLIEAQFTNESTMALPGLESGVSQDLNNVSAFDIPVFIQAAFGGRLPATDKLHYRLSLEAYHGLLTLSNADYFDGHDLRTWGAMASVGLSYSLTSRSE